MDEKNKKRDPWLLTLVRGQVLNPDAEALGKGPWTLFVAVVLVTSLLAAFPFVNDKFWSTRNSTNPAQYPGIYQLFQQIHDQGWSLHVVRGELTAGPGVPPQAVLGGWRVVVEPAGGDPQALAQVAGDTTARKVAFFGKTHFGLLDEQSRTQFDGTWNKLEGRSIDFIDTPLPWLLQRSATGNLEAAIFAVILLMFVQVVFLTVLLGFLLSLSRVQVLGTQLGAKRAAGFVPSLKTAGFVALGPALVTCVVASLLPGASGISWVGFSLLFGVRIITIYMGRFRNKAKAA